MPSEWERDFTADIALVALTETQVLTPTLTSVKAGQKVLLTAVAEVLQGAGAGALTLRIRRGIGTGGVQLGEDIIENMPAAERHTIAATWSDVPLVDDPQYTLTLRGAVAGTAENGSLLASRTD